MQKTKTISFVLVIVLLSTIMLTIALTCNLGSVQAEMVEERLSTTQQNKCFA